MTSEEAKKRFETIEITEIFHEDDEEAQNLEIQACEGQQPCEDCISREKAKQFLYERVDRLNDDELYDIFSRIIDDMYNELPPVTPQRPKGNWIYNRTINNWVCSECNNTPKTLGYVGGADFMKEHFKYCNHCGAEMEGGLEDVDREERYS